MRTFDFRWLTAASVTVALSACGGGSSSSTPAVPTPAATFAPPSQMNSYTSYTVYQGTATDGFVYLEVMPLNVAPSDLAGAAPVPGAVIQYPDNSAQVTDVLGNFDASKSSWAAANQSQILSNPNIEPSVVAFDPGTTLPPADAAVQVFSSSSNLVSAVRPMTSATTPELAGVSVFPRGYALFDTELRTYHAVGLDSDGTFAPLASATVVWSVTVPSGCTNAPAGKIAATSGDPTRAIYTPPSSGTFPTGCQDLVTASVTANGASFNGSGSAFYYDSSAGATVTGVLSDSTGKPVASGLVDLYGGGREFYHGRLYAIADASGTFKRLVPPNRTLYPFAGNPVTAAGKTTYSFFAVNPATVTITGPKTTVTQNLAETTAAVNPFKPLPPLERAIRDSWSAHDIAEDGLPFGGASAGGTFPAGSLEKILSAPGPANASGALTSGPFATWTYKWDATGKIVVVQQPATQEGARHVLQFTTGVTTMAYGGACPAGNSCFNFVEYYNPIGFSSSLPSPLSVGSLPSGSIVSNDGSFAQAVSASAFTVSTTRNTYSVGHQTIGSPLYSHTGTYQQTPGSATLNIVDTWTNASNKTLATYTGSRVAGTSPTLFTYSGTGSRSFYKPDGTALATVAFSVSNGVQNNDHSGGFTATYVSGLPNPSDNGTAVTWTLNASGTTRATGTVTNPNITGLQTANVATFTVANTLVVTVTTDPNLGGNTIAFHL